MSDEQAPFEVVLTHLDGYARVTIRGDFDYRCAIEHADALREVTDLRSRVVLDLADLTFMDSSGIAFLLRLSRSHDRPVRLENVPRHVTTLLDITALASDFDIDAE